MTLTKELPQTPSNAFLINGENGRKDKESIDLDIDMDKSGVIAQLYSFPFELV